MWKTPSHRAVPGRVRIPGHPNHPTRPAARTRAVGAPRGSSRGRSPSMQSRATPRIAIALAALAALVSLAAPAFAVARPPALSPVTAPAVTVTPARGSQWYHTVLGLAQAQRISQGAGVVVAVIDGGVDATSPKLRGQLLRGAGIGADAAPDGWRDDDPDGHGTAMAGIIAGRNDDGPPEVRGIAPAARILPISTGRETDSQEVAIAVHRAVDLGAGVINLSLGSVGAATADEREAVSYALAHDVVVVASAGNVDSGDTDGADAEINSPANIPGVVAVTGSTARGAFWHGSAHGPQAVIAAPAPGVRAPVPASISPDRLDTGSGTSNSAAIVSGVVALIRSARPDLDATGVIARLVHTARDAGPPGRDVEFGFGIVDPVAALTRSVPVAASNPLLPAPTRWGAPGQPPAGADPAAAAPAGGDGPAGADQGVGTGGRPVGGGSGQSAPGPGGATDGSGGPGSSGTGTGIGPGQGGGTGTDAGAEAGGTGGGEGTDQGGGQGSGQDPAIGGRAGTDSLPGGAARDDGGRATARDDGWRPGGASPLAWVAGLGFAVWLGGALGVGAHLLHARRAQARAARGRSHRPATGPRLTAQPGPPLG
ncbi:Subtilisin-like serine protease [Frankia canadensis]|uniref:Subtilisin-like serine protease n=1 Tax=Frankia canadensis TaxID=1836972 RepID=A0A2I2L105_9ACTN|nr:S8 family serine peptidase [Frankia canadensis]SNQ51612.1 Subtilisin-like serine protease [Frankia canadensis]SOU58902.1 Subtilisin-like serine protease [Frankia canadensis]